MASDERLSLAYLIGHYPGVSLTFILREIQMMREMGFVIKTASINAAEPSEDGFTQAESEEQRRTFYVKARGALRIAADHISCMATRPLGYIRGLLFALRTGGLDLRQVLYHLFYFAEAVVVGQWMMRSQLRHVHVHFANNTATVALITTRIFPVRYSVTVHGSHEFYGTVLYRLKEKIEGAAFLCCISNFTSSQLMRISHPREWSKFHVTPLGVDPKAFPPRPNPGGDPVRIVCVARLSPEKGHPVLVSAVARVIRQGRRVHLDLVGDGPYRGVLEEMCRELQIESAVTFHGSMNQTRLRPVVRGADIFVLPSFAEGVPVALMEAMALEIPCVSTFTGGIPELIDSGTNGILVPPANAEMLAEALDKLAGDPELRLCLGRAGRQKIMEAYDLGTNTLRLAAVFQEQLGHGPGRLAAASGEHAGGAVIVTT